VRRVLSFDLFSTALMAAGMIAAAILAAPVAATAQPFEVVDAPSCVNNKGEQVAFRVFEGGQRPLAAGMARRGPDGVPLVMRSNFAAAPKPMQQFIDRHECAHHQTGDVDMPHPPRNGPEHLMNEAVADCIAVLRLRDEEGYDAGRLKRVIEALSADMKKIGFPDVSVSSRVRNIESCFAREGGADELINARLGERGLK
jgi:hypothetical protein